MIKWEIWNRVFHFSGEANRPGAAFVVDVEGQQYLITAKHLCIDEPEEQVTLSHAYVVGPEPLRMVLERVGPRGYWPDVAAFRLQPGQLDINSPVIPFDSDGFAVTQDCFIMGFPHTNATRLDPGGLFILPLVKKGILAGFGKPIDGIVDMYLDVFANPGFSGGPVVFHHLPTNTYRFAGVVVRTMRGALLGPQGDEYPEMNVPAGISIAVPHEAVHALLAGQ